jgi:hypothetical protein
VIGPPQLHEALNDQIHISAVEPDAELLALGRKLDAISRAEYFAPMGTFDRPYATADTAQPRPRRAPNGGPGFAIK